METDSSSTSSGAGIRFDASYRAGCSSAQAIVGNSLAAGAAVIVAADHPRQVDGLALVGPYVRNPPSNVFTRAMFHTMMAPLWVALMWKSYMASLYAGRKPDDFDDYRTAVVASLKRKAYGTAFSKTTRQTDHAVAEARLGEVAAPVVVIMGELDPDFEDPAAEPTGSPTHSTARSSWLPKPATIRRHSNPT
ncbi:hypothetical protein [Rhodococcus sp. IEGM 1330]|uniref:hypothetical protein n=1 Tax=Rhodococcus sp. IEGM 1330 TaxID=3082225 RepID=UPI002953E33F|nr:hypothetical protein [Rhodococcus sp. IEGM 1330]